MCSIINIKDIVNGVSKISGEIEREEVSGKKYSDMWDPMCHVSKNA